MQYYVASDTWDRGFPDLNDRRVNVAGAYVPLYTPDPNDGLPGIWVFGGRSENGCDPPYGRTEYYPIPVAGQCSILLVDDDWDQYAGEPFNGSGTYYYTSTLEALGYGYDRWDVWTQGDPALADLQNYDVVIWFTGYAWSGTITLSNEADLAAYLAGGGNLLLSSEDYLYERGITPFARLYLGIEEAETDTGEIDLLGNGSDPIGHDLGPYTLITPTSWPLDDPSLYTDRVTPDVGVGAPFSFQASAADNSTDQDAGLWRTVFLAWPLEGLADLGERSVVLERALDWLCPAQREPAMSLLPAGQEGGGSPGAEVTYTLYLANNLGYAETFDLAYIGLAIFAQAMRDLGASWRLGIDEKRPGRLVTGGIYAFSRHPIYLFFNLYFLGTFLVNGTLIFLLFALLMAGTLHLQILNEEAFLLRTYGTAYRTYCLRTARYLGRRRPHRVAAAPGEIDPPESARFDSPAGPGM